MWSLVILTKVILFTTFWCFATFAGRKNRKTINHRIFSWLPNNLLFSYYQKQFERIPETFSKITGIWNRIRMLSIGILKSKKQHPPNQWGDIWMFRLLLIKKDKHTPLLEETPGCSGFFTQIGKICSLTTDLWSTDMTIVRSCACLRGRRGADDGFSIANCV